MHNSAVGRLGLSELGQYLGHPSRVLHLGQSSSGKLARGHFELQVGGQIHLVAQYPISRRAEEGRELEQAPVDFDEVPQPSPDRYARGGQPGPVGEVVEKHDQKPDGVQVLERGVVEHLDQPFPFLQRDLLSGRFCLHPSRWLGRSRGSRVVLARVAVRVGLILAVHCVRFLEELECSVLLALLVADGLLLQAERHGEALVGYVGHHLVRVAVGIAGRVAGSSRSAG